jgi:undecaprenyl-diphosphatase
MAPAVASFPTNVWCAMNLLLALLLGVVEGVTEFLPVSSTGHLTIVEKLFGLPIDDAGVTAFTAIIQVGAIAASVVYFRADIVRLARAWFAGVAHPEERKSADYRLAWLVIAGSIPIGVVGLAARHLIAGPLRNLWIVVGALVVWSLIMVIAERVGTQHRHEADLRVNDALVVGVMQCLALVPGVSRSGATISGGLFVGLDRVTATRLSFFLAIPALLAAGAYEAATSASDVSATVGWTAVAVGTVVSFVTALGAIAGLLRLVARFPITVFVGYRLALAAVIAVLLATGTVSAV